LYIYDNIERAPQKTGENEMDNALISNEAISTAQGWCYSAKAQDTAANVFTEKENTAGQSLMMAPSSFGIQPYKFIARETAKETDKELRLTRMMAFGRSFAEVTGQSWG
jgi:hypothetical protein